LADVVPIGVVFDPGSPDGNQKHLLFICRCYIDGKNMPVSRIEKVSPADLAAVKGENA